MSERVIDLILNEIDCPVCGKTKILAYGTDMKGYVYKLSIKGRWQYFCSYHCFREAQKIEEERRAKQRAASRKKMAEVFGKTAKARAEKIRSEKNASTR